jgi:DNA-binding HxlR family transcriptional regulator
MANLGQFCPVAVASEIFAERWTPIILRELLSGSHRFNEIHRCIPLISRPLLVRRLRDLEAAGVVRSTASQKGKPREYHLTEAGLEFRAAIEALGTWGQRWTVRVRREKLDSSLLMWNIRRRVALDRLPERRVVANFEFRGIPSGRSMMKKCWLILERSGCDVCVTDPGYEVDLWVDADLASMAGVWLGDLSFAAAVREKKIRLAGTPALVREFPAWLLLSHFASVPRPLQRGELHERTS